MAHCKGPRMLSLRLTSSTASVTRNPPTQLVLATLVVGLLRADQGLQGYYKAKV